LQDIIAYRDRKSPFSSTVTKYNQNRLGKNGGGTPSNINAIYASQKTTYNFDANNMGLSSFV